MQWGLDVVGLLLVAAVQKMFILCATDYFTKSVEIEAYTNVKNKDMRNFL